MIVDSMSIDSLTIKLMTSLIEKFIEMLIKLLIEMLIELFIAFENFAADWFAIELIENFLIKLIYTYINISEINSITIEK